MGHGVEPMSCEHDLELRFEQLEAQVLLQYVRRGTGELTGDTLTPCVRCHARFIFFSPN